jgi:hypothetical protein
MRYFTCERIEQKPFLKFDCCARDESELVERQLGINGDESIILAPGVFREDELPKKEYGVYVLDLKDGVLIPRDPTQLSVAASEIKMREAELLLRKQDALVQNNIAEGFVFDGHIFSLSSNAQINWLRIGQDLILSRFKDREIPTRDNQLYRQDRCMYFK